MPNPYVLAAIAAKCICKTFYPRYVHINRIIFVDKRNQIIYVNAHVVTRDNAEKNTRYGLFYRIGKNNYLICLDAFEIRRKEGTQWNPRQDRTNYIGRSQKTIAQNQQ